jgi:hypothetical protein
VACRERKTIHVEEDYKGRLISVDTQEVRRGAFRWSYQIDDGPLRRSEDRPLAEELMLAEALSAAKREIDAKTPS